MESIIINEISRNNIRIYAEIYAKAFSGEMWNDNWSVSDAKIHIAEIMESKQSYGLECVVGGKIAGFLLGSSMLFHWGRVFEINDISVHPDYQGQGIATKLLNTCLKEMKQRGVKGVNLITQDKGFLPEFYEKHGFKKENKVILMGMEL